MALLREKQINICFNIVLNTRARVLLLYQGSCQVFYFARDQSVHGNGEKHQLYLQMSRLLITLHYISYFFWRCTRR